MGEVEAGVPGSKETREWDDQVSLCPGLSGAVLAADGYLLIATVLLSETTQFG